MKKELIVICLLFFIEACSIKQVDKIHILKAGIGFDSIRIGITTREDLVKYYGKWTKADTFYVYPITCSDSLQRVIYSFGFSYSNLGLTFYFRPYKNHLSSIWVYSPFKAKTKEGIVLNESTFDSVLKIYGDQGWEFIGEEKILREYDGMKFEDTC